MAIERNLMGQTLGGYRIIEQIGRGGMAVVYKAYEPALDRYVAIKVLPQYFAHDPDFAARFEREAKAVAKLHHPNILPIYGVGLDAGLNYIAMQYVEAGTLKDMLGTPLDLKTASEIVEQIGRALDYAHKRGLIHRDVKPANVLIAEGDWVLLTDFGLARMVESSIQLTKSGVGVGTPAYMSPEQGQGKTVDARSDVYSLGVVLYEMLTGRVPFDADTPMAIVIQHMTAPLPLPRQANPDLPETVERVILKALAKDADARFQTAQELTEALNQAVAEVEVAGPPPPKTTVERPAPPAQAHGPTAVLDQPSPAPAPLPVWKRVPLWAWGAVVGLALLLFIGVIWVATQEPSPATPTSRPGTSVPIAVAEAANPTHTKERVVAATSTNRPAPEPTASPPPDDARPAEESGVTHYATGIGLMDENRYSEAMGQFNEAVAQGYENADLFHNRGWACHELDFFEDACDLEQALADFTRAIDLDPEGVHHYQARASTYLRLGQPERALADSERATELNPNDGGTWADRGWVHMEMGNAQRALLDFEQAVELNPNSARFLGARAAANMNLDRFDAALLDLNRAVEIEPTHAGFWLDRGWAHKTIGDLQAALDDFGRAIHLEPDNPAGYRARGSAFVDMDDPQHAVEDISRAIELDPHDTGAYRDRAWAYHAIGDYQMAIEDLNEAVRRDPEEPWNYIDRALLLDENMDNPDQAIADLNRAIELAPDSVDALFHRAMFYLRHSEWDAAVADLTRAVRLAPDWPNLYGDLGNAFAQLGDEAKARENFHKFLELTEGDPGFEDWRREILEWLDAHP